MPYVSDLAKIPFSVGAMGRSFATGDVAGGFANLGLALGQGAWALGKYHAGKKWEADFKLEAYLLEVGLQLCQALTLLHGTATDQGQYYELGSKDFDLAWESLNDATASEGSWSGDSADAYNDRNAEQMTRMKTMADLDRQIAAILLKQAGQVDDSKLFLTYCRATFTVAIPIAVALRRYPGPWASWLFQVTTFISVMGFATGNTLEMMNKAIDNGYLVDVVTADYRAAAEGAVLTGPDTAAAGVAAASKSVVGEFESPAGAPPLAGAPAAVAAPAAPSAGSSDRLASPASTEGIGDGGSAGSYSPAQPSEDEASQTQAAPAYAAPAASQSLAPGARASSASARPQAVTADASPAREATVEDAVLLQDAEAAGAVGGERAPIEARGAEPARDVEEAKT